MLFRQKIKTIFAKRKKKDKIDLQNFDLQKHRFTKQKKNLIDLIRIR